MILQHISKFEDPQNYENFPRFQKTTQPISNFNEKIGVLLYKLKKP